MRLPDPQVHSDVPFPGIDGRNGSEYAAKDHPMHHKPCDEFRGWVGIDLIEKLEVTQIRSDTKSQVE